MSVSNFFIAKARLLVFLFQYVDKLSWLYCYCCCLQAYGWHVVILVIKTKKIFSNKLYSEVLSAEKFCDIHKIKKYTIV